MKTSFSLETDFSPNVTVVFPNANDIVGKKKYLKTRMFTIYLYMVIYTIIYHVFMYGNIYHYIPYKTKRFVTLTAVRIISSQVVLVRSLNAKFKYSVCTKNN